VDVVVHAAARVHIMRDTATDPLTQFRRVNVAGTLKLAREAAAAGVTRLVFLSSVKVNGERTVPGHPFMADDAAAPCDPYGTSKLEAEHGLREVAAATGLEVVIIRPVLVYGPGVAGNFLQMMRWLARGVPLPLGGIANRRSLLALDNLADLVTTVATHPAAPDSTFLVSDGEDISTSDLLARLARAMHTRARLIPVPAALVRAAALALGKRGVAERLLGSLQVDSVRTREALGWVPPVTLDEGLRRTAEWYLRGRDSSQRRAALSGE